MRWAWFHSATLFRYGSQRVSVWNYDPSKEGKYRGGPEMRKARVVGDGQKRSLPARVIRMQHPHVFAFTLGLAVIGGLTAYLIQHDYQGSLNLWRSQLSATVLYRTWTLRNSLQQSRDDVQVLAGFAPTREVLRGGTGGIMRSRLPVTAQKQVLGLFEEYRKIYEYAALYLLDNQGRVVVQATDPGKWSTVIRSPRFNEILGSVTQTRRYSVALVDGPEQELTLIFMTPVFANSTTGRLQRAPETPIGIAAILDPFSRELLPLLTSRSVRARTADTVLLRLHNGEGHYTSPRRSAASDSPSDTLVRAASSAAEDRAVFGQFVDSQGVRVLAAMQKIPSMDSVVVSSWTLRAFAFWRRCKRSHLWTALWSARSTAVKHSPTSRSEERRVGKECRS